MDKKIDVGASCTWGDGPDVLITLDGRRFTCYEAVQFSKRAGQIPGPFSTGLHGFVTKGSIAFTRNEALELAQQIFTAAAQCREEEADKLHTHLDTQDITNGDYLKEDK